MKLIIFGATGMVGKQLVKQALYNGHRVKAFGRNVFTEGLPENDNLELVHGALFDAGQVYHAIKGCDAVLSSLGGASDGTDKTRSLGMKNIVAQMEKASVKRIVAVGGVGILNAGENGLLLDEEDYPPQYVAVGKEHKKAYDFLSNSNLEWTLVCPPDLVEGEATGQFITNADYPPEPNKNRIHTGDLALFMLSELNKNEYIKHRVGISN
jgi:putative NADH-flavin reductase